MKTKGTKAFLVRSVGGFNGVTHLLIGVLIFGVVYALPLERFGPVQGYFEHITRDPKTVLISFLVIVGGSLFPDLDSPRSTAEFRLGNTGKSISYFMKITGTAIWKLYHFRRDKSLSYKHRAIYHTPLIVVAMAILFSRGIPDTPVPFLQDLGVTYVKDLPVFLLNHSVVFLVLFLAFVFIRLAIATLTYRAFKRVFKNQFLSDMVSIALSAPLAFWVSEMSYNDIKHVSATVLVGYSSHLIGDLFTRGSIPLLYPIPVRGEAYYRPNFPLQISTNEGPSKVTNRIIIVLIVFVIIYDVYKI